MRIFRRGLYPLWTLLLLSRPAEAQEALRLDLNIPEQVLVVWEGAHQVARYPVSVGMPGHDTPTGEFSISHAEWNPWWTPPAGREWTQGRVKTPPGPTNPMGRVKLFFAPLYFLHGTPEEDKIGTPASRGCVRMRNRDIIALARRIHAHSAPHVSPAQIDQWLRSPTQTQPVRFRPTVRLEIRYDRLEIQGDSLRVYPDPYGYGLVYRESFIQSLLNQGRDPQRVSGAELDEAVSWAQSVTKPESRALRDVFLFLDVPLPEAKLAIPRPLPSLRGAVPPPR